MHPLIRHYSFSAHVLLSWLYRSLLLALRRVDRPVHILFCMVDHYEPGTNKATPEVEQARVQELLTAYPPLAERHRDAAGRPLQRTWFFPPHYHRLSSLKRLVSLCERGFGEVELHLHHGKIKPDTRLNMERTIRYCLDEYSRFGIFGRENGLIKYGFIHGDWALNNSRHGRYCGVDNEYEILQRTGCYADFTFPSMNEANPLRLNTILIPNHDGVLHRFKGRRTLAQAQATGKDPAMILVPGPAHPHFIKPGLSGLRAVGDCIDGSYPMTGRRVACWVDTAIHASGRPDWVIIKTHTHGAVDSKAVLGKDMDVTCELLESRYNDGRNYILHYLTARQLYNVIRAADAGERGDDPDLYLDYAVKPPCYDSSPDLPEASAELKACVAHSYGSM